VSNLKAKDMKVNIFIGLHEFIDGIAMCIMERVIVFATELCKSQAHAVPSYG
jgi:hypothetical protein